MGLDTGLSSGRHLEESAVHLQPELRPPPAGSGCPVPSDWRFLAARIPERRPKREEEEAGAGAGTATSSLTN